MPKLGNQPRRELSEGGDAGQCRGELIQPSTAKNFLTVRFEFDLERMIAISRRPRSGTTYPNWMTCGRKPKYRGKQLGDGRDAIADSLSALRCHGTALAMLPIP
jgi:hypothetical protein